MGGKKKNQVPSLVRAVFERQQTGGYMEALWRRRSVRSGGSGGDARCHMCARIQIPYLMQSVIRLCLVQYVRADMDPVIGAVSYLA